MTRKVTISCDNISSKQWSVLLIELNLVKDAWRPYARLDIQAPDFEKVIRWGKRKHNEKETK
tara:strand:+ start:48 stop:233 length:186 start_codon:yes stop_codon:yes gene_type:complete